NCERLRRRTHVPAPAVPDIQNVISWMQPHSIIAILIRGHPRDFVLSVAAQDGQRIAAVVRRRSSRRRRIRKLDLFGRNNVQVSLNETRWRSVSRSGVGEQQYEPCANQILWK